MTNATEGKEPIKSKLSAQESSDDYRPPVDTVVNGWIGCYKVAFPRVSKTTLQGETAERCDIDPETGSMLPPIYYPDTSIDPDVDDDLRMKAKLTSGWHLDKRLRQHEQAAMERRHRKKLEEANANVSVFPEEKPGRPTADCTVRHVCERDYPAIAAILNAEGQAGCPQALDKKTRSVDIQRIHLYSDHFARPFIVAVKESNAVFLDRSKWPVGADRQYAAFVKAYNKCPKEEDVVVGCAWITEARIGPLCQPCPGSRFSGMLHVFVHPDHRRNGYGSALLDRLLMSISPHHAPVIDYNFTDEGAPAKVYDYPATYNIRSYSQCYAETLRRGEEDTDAQGLASFMQKFDLKQVAHLPKAVKTDRENESEWLDIILWQFQCQYTDDVLNKSFQAMMADQRRD